MGACASDYQKINRMMRDKVARCEIAALLGLSLEVFTASFAPMPRTAKESVPCLFKGCLDSSRVKRCCQSHYMTIHRWLERRFPLAEIARRSGIPPSEVRAMYVLSPDYPEEGVAPETRPGRKRRYMEEGCLLCLRKARTCGFCQSHYATIRKFVTWGWDAERIGAKCGLDPWLLRERFPDIGKTVAMAVSEKAHLLEEDRGFEPHNLLTNGSLGNGARWISWRRPE